MVDEITKYKCGGCGSVYEDNWDADDCCRPDTLEVTLYICEECEQEWETEQEAKDCWRKHG